MVMQCLGAICGAGVVKGFQPGRYQTDGGGANIVAHGYTKGDGLGAEIVGTFVLVYTVFSATDAKRNARDSHVPVSIVLLNLLSFECLVLFYCILYLLYIECLYIFSFIICFMATILQFNLLFLSISCSYSRMVDWVSFFSVLSPVCKFMVFAYLSV